MAPETGRRARLLGRLARELGTPLAALVAEVQLARRAPPASDVHAFLGRAAEELEHLRVLVERILALAQLEHGPRKERVSVDDLLRLALLRSTTLAAERGVALVLELAPFSLGRPPFVRGDGQLLRVLFDCLLQHALARTPRGATLRLRTTLGAEVGVVLVADRPAPGGTGTAGAELALAERVARAHGGSLIAEVGEDGACTYVVQLPRRRVRRAARALPGS